MTQTYTPPYEADRYAKLNVPDLCGNRDPETYLDWVHSIEAYLSHELQFVEAKLKKTTLMRWQQHKESYDRASLDTISTWDEMKAKLWIRGSNLKIIGRGLIFNWLSLDKELWQWKFTLASFSIWLPELASNGMMKFLFHLNRQGLQPHISQRLSCHYYTFVDDAIKENMQTL